MSSDLSWPQKQKMIEQDRGVVRKIIDSIDKSKIVGYYEIGCWVYGRIFGLTPQIFNIAGNLENKELIFVKFGEVFKGLKAMESNTDKFQEYNQKGSSLLLEGKY